MKATSGVKKGTVTNGQREEDQDRDLGWVDLEAGRTTRQQALGNRAAVLPAAV